MSTDESPDVRLRNRNSRGAGGGDGIPFGIFPAIIKGWSGLELR